MGKFFAVLLIIVLFVGIYYIYDINARDVGVKIDKLKLKYTIGENAPPEKILLFANELDKLSLNAENKDKKVLFFEANYWKAVGVAKEVSAVIGSADIGIIECGTDDITMKNKLADAQVNLKTAKTEYELIKSHYSNVGQQDFEAKLENLQYSLDMSENLIFILCPQ